MAGCVITGVAGFVGSHLAERILLEGHQVIGIDNLKTGHLENMATFINHPCFTFYKRSIIEKGILAFLHKNHPGLSHCFHLAAIVSVPYSVEHADETMEINYFATRALLNEAKELNFSTFIFAGSAAEYGEDDRLPLTEVQATEQKNHLSPYGLSKFRASTYVGLNHNPHGIALRCFNIYGPRQDPHSPYSGVIARFMEAGLRNDYITIYGDGRQTRDFIYVSDVVNAYLYAAGMQNDLIAPPVGIYNIATGKGTTILELAGIVKQITENKLKMKYFPERSGDIRHSVASTDKFHQATGWKPQLSLQEGLNLTMEWTRRSLRQA
jgi:UDP-glucose 4-epimerase